METMSAMDKLGMYLGAIGGLEREVKAAKEKLAGIDRQDASVNDIIDSHFNKFYEYSMILKANELMSKEEVKESFIELV